MDNNQGRKDEIRRQAESRRNDPNLRYQATPEQLCRYTNDAEDVLPYTCEIVDKKK